MKPLRIGMYGGGTVGGGVYELIMNNKNNKARNIVISHICVRDLSKPRTFQIDESVTTLTTDIEAMMKFDDIDCIVEGTNERHCYFALLATSIVSFLTTSLLYLAL